MDLTEFWMLTLENCSMTFSVEGKTFTPVQYADFLGIKPEAYVELTSFTHDPILPTFYFGSAR
jgi:hypothetical protein